MWRSRSTSQVAQLMAIVSTDQLNARTEPNTTRPIWTQISTASGIRLRASRMAGRLHWMRRVPAVATEFVDVRYALNEAIEFTPAEETPEPETKAASSKGGSGSKSSSNGGSGSQKASSSGSSSSVRRSQTTRLSSWESVCMGRYQLDKWYGLFWIYDVGYGTLRRHSPHHSGSQAGAGRSISSSQMRPGDSIYTNSGGTINHVALYIGGGRVHMQMQGMVSRFPPGITVPRAKIVNALGD